MDAPHSPPEYDQKARNEQTTVEYQETEMGGASTDVDHRTLTDVLARKIDIDHRNLISLTGSPGQGGVSDAFSKPSTDTVSDWLLHCLWLNIFCCDFYFILLSHDFFGKKTQMHYY